MAVVECVAVAYAVLSYLITFLAWLGLASRAAILSAALLTALGATLWLWRRHLRQAMSAQEPSAAGIPAWILLAALAPLVHVLAVPPYLRDDLIYHLLVPSRIAQSGRFLFDPHNVNANLPTLFEMPLAVTESLGGVSPFIVNLAVLLGIAVVFSAMAREQFGLGDRLAALAAVTAAYTPVIYDLTHSCYVELFFALLVMLAFRRYLAFRDERERQDHWWIAMALLGLACATKYFGLLYLAFVAAVEFFSWRGPRRRYYLGLALALAVACPWYVKNWVALGNPVFPLLSSLFPSPYLSAARAFQFSRLAANYHDGRTFVDFMLLPVKLVTGCDPAPAVARLGFDGRIGLFLLLAFLGLRFRAPRQRLIAGLFAAYALFWAASSQQVRFLLPVILLASLSGLQLLDGVLRRRRAWLAVILIAVLAQDLFWIAHQASEQKIAGLLTGRVTREQFLGHHAPVSYTMAQEVNRLLDPSRHRLLTVGNYGRDYYFRVPVVTHTYYDTEPFDRAFARDSADPAVLAAFLREERITHVLFDWGYYRGQVHPTGELVDTDALQVWLRARSRPVLRQGAVELLELGE